MIVASLLLLAPLSFLPAAPFPQAAPAAPAAAATGRSPLVPAQLRCEHLVDPLGIDVVRPRLSWILESAENDQAPKARRVLVSEDPALLETDAADVWDSGKVEDDGELDFEYAGSPLRSHQRLHWKVMVWDRQDRPSAWSATATWSMGPLAPEDWKKAQWIGWDGERAPKEEPSALDGAKWIGFAGDEPSTAPEAVRWYAATAKLPASAKVASAELHFGSDNRGTVVLNGASVLTETPDWKQAKRADVAKLLRPGDNDLRVMVRNDAVGWTGMVLKLIVVEESGARHEVSSDGSWRASDRMGDDWKSAPIDLGDASRWTPARVIGDYGCDPWKKLQSDALRLPPVPLLRTSFTVAKPTRRATLYVSALGLCDARLNGARVSDDSFTPGWTDYRKRVGWRAYDVTMRVKLGENVLGAELADGWYCGYVGWGRARDHYGRVPRAKLLLHLEATDGTSQDVVSDGSWQARPGATRQADFLMGESVDARLAVKLEGWDAPASEKLGEWHPVDVGAEVDPRLQWHPGPPVRAFAELAPVAITQPQPGLWVFDLGQNFAGVARLRVSGGKQGQKVRLRFAERLNPDGTAYTENLRGARATDSVTLSGAPVETFQPRFTFHGFQYVEVTGLESPPTKETVTGVALSSAAPQAGRFECAEPMLNKLWSNALWTQRANFIEVPTDCPQRDERLGWTGDAQVFCRTATYNVDAQAFFEKWVTDLIDSQRADGQFPMVAPLIVAGGDGGPAWADAGVIVPFTVWEAYGDRRLLERAYPAMVKFLEFCRGRCTAELLPPKEFHCFGDWLNIDAPTPNEVIYLAYLAHCTDVVARAADALQKYEEGTKLRAQFGELRRVFQRAYLKEDGTIHGGSQTAYAMAISFGLLDWDQEQAAAEKLLADVHARGDRLSTGFVGTKDLMLALSKIGRADVAWHLLKSREFPSWGFTIEHGATSIWERWDGWTPAKGFQDPGMNSFAHYAFGSVYQWMFENVGGIRAEEPGWSRISIAPKPDPAVPWAKTSLVTPRGEVATSWKFEGGRFELDVRIPVGATATVQLPSGDAKEVGSGNHRFVDGGAPAR
jgi:alpha-L-rhamnosidase